MNCIVCKKVLENTGPSPCEENQPSGGTSFQSRGHYGSAAFDPMDGTYLEINICDPCLVQAGTDGNVLIGFPRPSPPRGPMMQWPLVEVESERHGNAE